MFNPGGGNVLNAFFEEKIDLYMKSILWIYYNWLPFSVKVLWHIVDITAHLLSISHKITQGTYMTSRALKDSDSKWLKDLLKPTHLMYESFYFYMYLQGNWLITTGYHSLLSHICSEWSSGKQILFQNQSTLIESYFFPPQIKLN